MVGYDAFEKALEEGKKKTLERLRVNFEKASLDNIHKCMSWWACFRKDDDMESLPDASDRLLDIPTVNPGKAQAGQGIKKEKSPLKQIQLRSPL